MSYYDVDELVRRDMAYYDREGVIKNLTVKEGPLGPSFTFFLRYGQQSVTLGPMEARAFAAGYIAGVGFVTDKQAATRRAS